MMSMNNPSLHTFVIVASPQQTLSLTPAVIHPQVTFPLVLQPLNPRVSALLSLPYFTIGCISTSMIIVEESQDLKPQPNHDPNVAVATSRTPLIPPESPPAYTPRENPGPSSSSTLQYNHPPPPPVPPKRRPKHVAGRFAKALLIAFGSYVVMIAVVRFLIFAIDVLRHDVSLAYHHIHP